MIYKKVGFSGRTRACSKLNGDQASGSVQGGSAVSPDPMEIGLGLGTKFPGANRDFYGPDRTVLCTSNASAVIA